MTWNIAEANQSSCYIIMLNIIRYFILNDKRLLAYTGILNRHTEYSIKEKGT
jgi:hypothetical protein